MNVYQVIGLRILTELVEDGEISSHDSAEWLKTVLDQAESEGVVTCDVEGNYSMVETI